MTRNPELILLEIITMLIASCSSNAPSHDHQNTALDNQSCALSWCVCPYGVVQDCDKLSVVIEDNNEDTEEVGEALSFFPALHESDKDLLLGNGSRRETDINA